MDKDNIFSLENSGCFEYSLTELLRTSAQQMLAQAIEMERDELLGHYRGSAVQRYCRRLH